MHLNRFQSICIVGVSCYLSLLTWQAQLGQAPVQTQFANNSASRLATPSNSNTWKPNAKAMAKLSDVPDRRRGAGSR